MMQDDEVDADEADAGQDAHERRLANIAPKWGSCPVFLSSISPGRLP